MEKTEALSLIRDFTRSMPVSGMGLLYLMEKGSDVVKATSEAEYLAAVDQQIAEARERNHVCLLSRQVSLNLFRFAKRLAELAPVDLVAILGEVYRDHYLELMGEDQEENEAD
jgi:hypothetical protein